MEPDSAANDRSNASESKPAAAAEGTHLGIVLRAFAIWLVLIVAEILHGIARGIFLVPHVGEFRSSQIGVFTGSVIILADRPGIRAMDRCDSPGSTAHGRLSVAGPDAGVRDPVRAIRHGASWERLAADYNVLEGGLLPFGMLVLLLSPLIAAKVRGLKS